MNAAEDKEVLTQKSVVSMATQHFKKQTGIKLLRMIQTKRNSNFRKHDLFSLYMGKVCIQINLKLNYNIIHLILTHYTLGNMNTVAFIMVSELHKFVNKTK